MDVLALNLSLFVANYAIPIAMFVFGLGVVIFVHELGHFVMARMVGIHVETFALGMGPRLFGYRGKETDYCVRLVPIGGYVKMVGQEDLAPLTDGDTDPRSYANKTVGQRLLVIAAGVVMNLIFAAIGFVIIGLIGMPFMAPIIGGVEHGYPAANATVVWTDPAGGTTETVGLAPGDRVVSLNGRPILRFDRIKIAAMLAWRGEQFQMVIERQIDGQARTGVAALGLEEGASSTSEGGTVFMFGVTPAQTTELGDPEDLILPDDGFQTGDVLISVAGQDIPHHWDLRAVEKTLDGSPVPVVARPAPVNGVEQPIKTVTTTPFLRMGAEEYYIVFLKDGTVLRVTDQEPIDDDTDVQRYRMKLLDKKEYIITEDETVGVSVDVLGMMPRLRFDAIGEDGPADEARLLPGDVVLRYGAQSSPTLAQLRAINAASADTAVEIVVLRNGVTQQATTITPEGTNGGALIGVQAGVDQEHLLVAGVRPGSPAGKAGITPGCEIDAVNGQAVKSWPQLINALKHLAGKPVVLTGRNGAQPFEATFAPLGPDDFRPGEYRYRILSPRPFKLLMTDIQMSNPLEAIAWGAQETYYNAELAYASIRAIVTGTVSTKEVRGPLGMADIAVQVARKGVLQFVYFMSMISVMLAVFNFLPIPVLDGGHALFLLIEKIRGKPVSAKVTNIIQIVFIALLLGLFLVITALDFLRIIR